MTYGYNEQIKYRDLKELARIVTTLNRKGYDYIVDFGSRTVVIKKEPKEG